MSIRSLLPAVVVLAFLAGTATAPASHTAGGCTECASHSFWPKVNGVLRQFAGSGSGPLTGTARTDELLGHHGSDVLRGLGSADILWGDWDPKGQPSSQHDTIYGGAGNDLVYGSHGRNTIYSGSGNDAISVHYGRGLVDCGSGRDIYHVARSRKKGYTFRNCEKVDYRPESVRGTGLKPLK